MYKYIKKIYLFFSQNLKTVDFTNVYHVSAYRETDRWLQALEACCDTFGDLDFFFLHSSSGLFNFFNYWLLCNCKHFKEIAVLLEFLGKRSLLFLSTHAHVCMHTYTYNDFQRETNLGMQKVQYLNYFGHIYLKSTIKSFNVLLDELDIFKKSTDIIEQRRSCAY